jgi:hypothetical protein
MFDLKSITGGYEPKELFQTLVKFMQRTDQHLRDINAKLDILVTAVKEKEDDSSRI